MDATLFGAGGDGDSFDTFHSRLKAFASPVAVDVGAIIEDSDWSLVFAEAVYDAFGDLDQGRGLTRAQLVEHCLPGAPGPGVRRGAARRVHPHGDAPACTLA